MGFAGGKSAIRFDTGPASEMLREYAAAASDTGAAALLNRLFEEHIHPWCAQTARSTLRSYGVRGRETADEEAEIAAEVMLQMTVRLQAIRSGAAPMIGNPRAYAVTAVYNACFARIRARCPQHVQLQNRIRYLLRNDALFAAWTSGDGEQLAGFQSWLGRQEHVAAPPLQRSGEPLREMLRNIFNVANAPVRLSDLVGVVADSMGLAENTYSALPESEQTAAAPSADQVLIERQELMTLWNEVLQLPPSQRSALLLNLRDAGGNGVIELIPATGVATFEHLAETLRISTPVLAGIWKDLPLEDARIAEMLGVSRQQVINFRKAARERLARRRKNGNGNTGRPSPSGKGVADGMVQRIRAVFQRYGKDA
ncbi:MAG: hypothetical protein ABUS51_07660 [Acidobacteriota bacterium]